MGEEGSEAPPPPVVGLGASEVEAADSPEAAALPDWLQDGDDDDDDGWAESETAAAPAPEMASDEPAAAAPKAAPGPAAKQPIWDWLLYGLVVVALLLALVLGFLLF